MSNYEQVLYRLQTLMLRTNGKSANNSRFEIGEFSFSADSFVGKETVTNSTYEHAGIDNNKK
jgi:hypothetical protein